MGELADQVQRLHEANDQLEANPLDLSDGKRAVRAHNARMDCVWSILREVSASSEGRVALEDLARESPSAGLRVMSANLMMTWDRDLARDVLEEMVVNSGGAIVRPMTMTVALQAPHEVRDAALSLLNLNRAIPE